MPSLDCLARQLQLSYHTCAHNCVTDMPSGPAQEHGQVALTIVAGGLGLQQAQERATAMLDSVQACCALVDAVAVCMPSQAHERRSTLTTDGSCKSASCTKRSKAKWASNGAGSGECGLSGTPPPPRPVWAGLGSMHAVWRGVRLRRSRPVMMMTQRVCGDSGESPVLVRHWFDFLNSGLPLT